MISITHGNLLEAKAEALVNTVNTVGVMGKGIALQFRQAYPEMFRAYERACKAGEVQPGRMQIFELNTLETRNLSSISPPSGTGKVAREWRTLNPAFNRL